MTTIPLSLMRLPHGADLPLPSYHSAAASGFDLPAAVEEAFTLMPGAHALIPTGFAMALPEGFEGQVRPRSGLALRHGVTVLNAPGTVDADYRGEIKVLLINHGPAPFTITRGARIAQMVIAPVTHAHLALVPMLTETPRGGKGFGSTGIK